MIRGFELTLLGGPWGRRLAPRRAWIDDLPWQEPLPQDATGARVVWTRTAFSEYASAAAFAELTGALLAAGAPIDLVAAAGDFVVDEIVHTELAARLAAALGGAVALEVDLGRLVRPPTPAAAADPLLWAAELAVRTSCIGESLTVPMLRVARDVSGSPLIGAALTAIVADEAAHAQLGWWLLDWAAPRLDEAARDHLAGVATAAIAGFAPLLDGDCHTSGLGAVACDHYDPAFRAALAHAVVRPLADRGIVVSASLATARRGPASAADAEPAERHTMRVREERAAAGT
jgi:hypothetical protein